MPDKPKILIVEDERHYINPESVTSTYWEAYIARRHRGV